MPTCLKVPLSTTLGGRWRAFSDCLCMDKKGKLPYNSGMHLRSVAARAIVGVLTAFVASGYQTAVAPSSVAHAASVDVSQQTEIPPSCTPETYVGSFLYTSVDSYMKAEGITVDPLDIVSSDSSAMPPGYGLGFTFEICRVPTYLLSVAGDDQLVKSWAPTVRDLLQENNIEVADKDIVDPGLDTVLTWKGMAQQITITRVAESDLTVTQSKDFTVQTVNDSSMDVGTKSITQSGVNGVITIIHHIRRENGAVVEDSVVSNTVTKQPVNEIIHVGTHIPNVKTGVASYYKAVSGSAANLSLPIGTKITVTNLANGKSVSETVTNRGPFVAGRMIDIPYVDFAAIGNPSAGIMNVQLSW